MTLPLFSQKQISAKSIYLPWKMKKYLCQWVMAFLACLYCVPVPDWNQIMAKSLHCSYGRFFRWGWEAFRSMLANTHHTSRFPETYRHREYFILVPRRYKCPANVRIFVRKKNGVSSRKKYHLTVSLVLVVSYPHICGCEYCPSVRYRWKCKNDW